MSGGVAGNKGKEELENGTGKEGGERRVWQGGSGQLNGVNDLEMRQQHVRPHKCQRDHDIK